MKRFAAAAASLGVLVSILVARAESATGYEEAKVLAYGGPWTITQVLDIGNSIKIHLKGKQKPLIFPKNELTILFKRGDTIRFLLGPTTQEGLVTYPASRTGGYDLEDLSLFKPERYLIPQQPP